MSEFAMATGEREGGDINRWLFNPFYYIAGGKTLAIGIILMLMTGCLAFMGNNRFDGLIDFHIGQSAAPLWLNVSEILISWFLISILLLMAGKLLSKIRFRFVDVFGTQALARFPYLLVSMVALLPGVGHFAQKI